MYIPKITADRVKEMASKRGLSMSQLNEKCDLSVNVISQSAKSTEGMKAKNLYAIAETLECSVDYLLGRTDNPNSESKVIKDNHGNNNNVAFGINATELPVTIVPADNNLGENERELLKRFDSLDYEQKIEIMQMIIEKSKKKA